MTLPATVGMCRLHKPSYVGMCQRTWLTFLETNCLGPKVFVNIEPIACVRTIHSDLHCV